jgi:oxaloacetate decarboxylase alpha subunit
MPRTIDFVDTTLRDGHHSLWAMGMRTGMMLPVAETLDEAGFRAIEVFGAGHFRKCIKELKEDPWQRMKLMAGRVRRTPLSFMMLPSVSVFDVTPYSLMQVYITQLAAHGIGRVQIIDSSNDFGHRLPRLVEMIKHEGLRLVIGLVYSLSPKHDDAYYRRKAEEAAALKPDALFIKDPAGLLTPERTKSLTPAVLAGAGGVPVEFHGHCTTGLMPACYAEAMRFEIAAVHTAIPPLADGASQPSVYNTARNMARLGLPVPIDLAVLEPVTRHFDEIAEAEGLPKGVPLQFDVAQYVHAVPGGVISHLHHQLRQIGLFDRLEAVLDEIGRVRADLGHPIMVTPFSQFVCSQATLNVISGERYRQISDEIIALALGHWGREAAEDISPDLRDRILSTPRARTLLAEGREETPLAVIRDRLGGSAVSDPELILRYIAPLAEIAAMRAAGPHRSYETGGNALLHLVRSLVARERFDRISIEAGGNRLALARGTGPGGAP